MAQFLAQRWKRQPQGPVAVDWGNPLARGLVCAVSDSFEAVNRNRLTLDSRISRRPSPEGIGWYRETELSSGPNLSTSTGTKIPSGSQFTIAAVVRADPASSGDNRSVAYWGNDPRFWWSQSSSQFVFMQRDSADTGIYAVDYAATAAVMRAGTTVAGVWDGANIRLYRGGVQQASTALTSISTSFNENVLIGSNNAYFAWHWLGWIPALNAWARPLSDSELRAWHENPWQLFRAPKPIIYSLPAASAPVGGVFLRQRWKRQPQGPVAVDWGNPLARGASLLWTASAEIDAVSAARPVRLSPHSYSGGARGLELVCPGTQTLNSFYWPTSFDPCAGATSLTIDLLVRCDSLSTSPKILGSWPSGNCIIQIDSAGRIIAGVITTTNVSSTVLQNNGGTAITTGRYWHIGVTWVNPDIWTVYVDGVVQPTGSMLSTANGAVRSQGSNAFNLGISGDTPLTGAIVYTRVLKRAATGAEMREVAANLWQLFRAPKPIVFSLPGGTTIPTLSSPTVIDIGSTSARPRVTITI